MSLYVPITKLYERKDGIIMAVLTYVKNVRTSQNRQQKDMAAAIGTCPRTISNIEKGQYCPSLETALRIAKYLKVPVENLFELDESIEPIKE